MNKKFRDPAARRYALAGGTALVACLGTLPAACGGSNDELAAPIPTAAYRLAADVTPTHHWVQLEGCVVDEFFSPRAGTSVLVMAEDGRLVGATSSDTDGLFRVQVPAQEAVSIRIDKADGESLAVLTGRSNLSVGTCLRDPRV